MIMGSGRLNGYTQFAEDISNVLDNLPGANLRVIPVLGKSAGQNILDMLYLKGVDMGVVDQDILAYLKRTDPRGSAIRSARQMEPSFSISCISTQRRTSRLEDLRARR